MNKSVYVITAGIVVIAAAIALMIGGSCGEDPGGGGGLGENPKPPRDEAPEPASTPQLPPELKDLRVAALEQQARQEWCEAAKSWDDFHQKLAPHSELLAYREEASRNLEIARKRCDPPQEMVIERRFDPDPGAEENIPEDDLLAYYPVGRSVRSVLLLNVTGRGVDQHSLLKGESSFAYQYRVVGGTE
ncbi:MAG: hypothetical protein KY475_20615 [Planctomycetes bacterium]|nr:hypothetical protein [Planctomycetota bacterium]